MRRGLVGLIVLAAVMTAAPAAHAATVGLGGTRDPYIAITDKAGVNDAMTLSTLLSDRSYLVLREARVNWQAGSPCTAVLTIALCLTLPAKYPVVGVLAAGDDFVDAQPLPAPSGSGDFWQLGAGRDTLLAGPGTQTIEPEAGDDWIDGGEGSDTVVGAVWPAPGLVVSLDGIANDGPGGTGSVTNVERVFGTFATDVITGGAAADRLDGGDGGDDLVRGMAGNDNLSIGEGRVEGGLGDDTISFAAFHGSAVAEGGSGNDTITVSKAFNRPGHIATVFAGDGNDVIALATSSNDVAIIECGVGDDRVTGVLPTHQVAADCEDVVLAP